MPSSASRCSILGLSVACLVPSVALAAEGEAIVAVEAGVAILGRAEPVLGTVHLHDFAANASAWLGISDSVWAAASFGMSAPGQDHRAVEAVGGLVIALDVLRIIPFLEAMAGVLAARGTTFAALRLGAGFDYLWTEHFSVGVVGRYRPLQDELGEGLLTLEGRLAFRLEL